MLEKKTLKAAGKWSKEILNLGYHCSGGGEWGGSETSYSIVDIQRYLDTFCGESFNKAIMEKTQETLDLYPNIKRSEIREIVANNFKIPSWIIDEEIKLAFSKFRAIKDSELIKPDDFVRIVTSEYCCLTCKRLYTDKTNGKSIVFLFKELLRPCSNQGRFISEWRPTIPPLHMNCRCNLIKENVEYQKLKEKYHLPDFNDLSTLIKYFSAGRIDESYLINYALNKERNSVRGFNDNRNFSCDIVSLKNLNAYKANNLFDNHDGTIIDINNNLMWTKSDSFIDLKRPINFEEAQKYSSLLKTGGFEDWRVPSLLELVTIFDENEKTVSHDHDDRILMKYSSKFEKFGGRWFWSIYNGHCLFFGNGVIYKFELKNCDDKSVRPVRFYK